MINAASYLVAVALTSISVRRLALLVAALLPRRRTSPGEARLPSVTIVIPACNEGPHIEHLLCAIDRLEYPRESLFAVLVNDCSDDDTGERLARWAAERPRALAVDLPGRVGKAGALRRGIAVAPASELIAVCDADLRPRPDWLRELAVSFADETVGAASAFLVPLNSEASAVARYAAVETWVHQLVTSAGKDRLDLNPAAHGASVYRRVALEPMGWFSGDGPGEDVRTTVALTRRGWRTRFVPEAMAENTVVERLGDYWQQHVRWARNMLAAGSARNRDRSPAERRPPLRRRVEIAFASTGYADRLLFVIALRLAGARSLTPWVPGLYVGVTATEVATAVIRARAAGRLPRFLFAVVVLFPADVLASAVAGATHLARRHRTWETLPRQERAVPGADTPSPDPGRVLDRV